MTRNLTIIYGAGGHARVLLDIAQRAGISISFFVDDAPTTKSIDCIQVVTPSEAALERGGLQFIIGIGSNFKRASLYRKLAAYGIPINLIHPFCSLSTNIEMGRGIAVMPGVIVNAGATIADNAILNTSCSIDHDCVVGAHSHICPGVHLAGNVFVGRGTMIGTGSSVIPGIRIGENCLIGAGSTVVHDLPDHSVAYGSPARVVRPNEMFNF